MRLDALRSHPGLIAAILVGPDGLALDMTGQGDLLAAEVAELRHWSERTSRHLGGGRVTRMTFTAEKLEVVALASGDYLLAAAVARGLDTRPVQQALAQLALEIIDLPAQSVGL